MSAAPAAAPARAAEPAPGVYLHPGELFACAEPRKVTTILGSCVAACVFDPAMRVGGLTHHLLPYGAPGVERPGRFGNLALPALVDRLAALGARPWELRAKLFGGSCVLEAFRGDGEHLGARNVEVAREALDALGIRVVAEDVGGPRGRRLLFDTGDGTALVRLL
jgi:chemotaxis protein CheD